MSYYTRVTNLAGADQRMRYGADCTGPEPGGMIPWAHELFLARGLNWC